MTKKKKTNIPDHVIESLARCLYPAVVAFYESEEGKQEFAKWKAEQEKQVDKKEN